MRASSLYLLYLLNDKLIRTLSFVCRCSTFCIFLLLLFLQIFKLIKPLYHTGISFLPTKIIPNLKQSCTDLTVWFDVISFAKCHYTKTHLHVKHRSVNALYCDKQVSKIYDSCKINMTQCILHHLSLCKKRNLTTILWYINYVLHAQL